MVAGGKQDPTIPDDIAQAWNVACDYRKAASHGFERRQAKTVNPGWLNVEFGGGNQVRYIVPDSEEMYAASDTYFPGGQLHGLPQRPISGQQKVDPFHLGDRADQSLLVFGSREASHAEDGRCSIDGSRKARWSIAALEPPEVDSVGDHARRASVRT
jgi:hypothetical protein